jgi:hypothetical protein
MTAETFRRMVESGDIKVIEQNNDLLSIKKGDMITLFVQS